MGVSRDCQKFLGTPIISGTGKATDYKFGQYIQEKRKRGHIQGLPKFFGYPLLSQEREKLHSSNLARIFTYSEQNPIKNFGEKGA